MRAELFTFSKSSITSKAFVDVRFGLVLLLLGAEANTKHRVIQCFRHVVASDTAKGYMVQS